MEIERLKKEISKIATIQICKAGDVFTFLITGENLDNWQIVNSIQMDVLQCVGDKYPLIECMKNSYDFYCVVLTKKKQ